MTAFPSLFASGHNCHSTLVSILALESVPKVPSEPEPLPGLMCQGAGAIAAYPRRQPQSCSRVVLSVFLRSPLQEINLGKMMETLAMKTRVHCRATPCRALGWYRETDRLFFCLYFSMRLFCVLRPSPCALDCALGGASLRLHF